MDKVLKNSINTLKDLKVEDADDYVIGFNSRMNQYNEKQVIMLDFDDVSTIQTDKLTGEPGILYRTYAGYHFLGIKYTRKISGKVK